MVGINLLAVTRKGTRNCRRPASSGLLLAAGVRYGLVRVLGDAAPTSTRLSCVRLLRVLLITRPVVPPAFVVPLAIRSILRATPLLPCDTAMQLPNSARVPGRRHRDDSERLTPKAHQPGPATRRSDEEVTDEIPSRRTPRRHRGRPAKSCLHPV